MNERNNLDRDIETEPRLPVERIITAKEASEYFAFADPILGVSWEDENPPEEYTPEYIAIHPDETQIFVIKDQHNEIAGGAKIKKLTTEEIQRLGLNSGPFSNQNGALLEYTVVREDYRNKGLLGDLTKERIDWAKERGMDYVCAEIEIDNPISAYTKIRDGFVYTGIRPPSAGIAEPYLVAIKPISQENNKEEDGIDKRQPVRREVEVNANSFEELRRLFDEGFIGVDIKLNGENAPWILILEK